MGIRHTGNENGEKIMNNENIEKKKNDKKRENNYFAIALSLGVAYGILTDNLALGLALGGGLSDACWA